MSMRAKLLQAAEAAATEATTNERGRVLWCLEQVLAELKAKLGKKLLTEAQLHTARVKLQIAEAVVMELRRAIVSGLRPSTQGGPTGGGPGAADLCYKCGRAMDDPRGCDKELHHLSADR